MDKIKIMMAALFLIFSGIIALSYFKLRKTALWCLALGWILCALMFWHHVTDTLSIRL